MKIIFKIKKRRILFLVRKITSCIVIFALIGGWLFLGWPRIWNGEENKIPPVPENVQAAVPSGVIVAWPSTAASIPSGWSRVTALDTYYLEGTTSDPSGTAGGYATHTHSSPTHTHTVGHSHSSTSTGSSLGSSATRTGTGGAPDVHTHTVDFNASSGSNIDQSANLGTASNDPPYTEVIWIKSDGSTDIPDGAWALFNSDTLPSSWTRQSGNRFLRGAVASGNGGGTGGFSDSHPHTDSGHTHTENSHTHTGTINAQSSQVRGKSGSGISAYGHTHTFSGGSVTATETSDAGLIQNADGQPPFHKLNIIQNGTGGADTPDDVIAMWDGTISSIPSGWVVCDGTSGTPNLNNVFIKGANADSEIGTTDGATSHTHDAGATHSHTINSHAHNFSVALDGGTNDGTLQSGTSAANYTHTHTLSVTGGGSTGTATITASANTAGTSVPPYKEIVYIQFQGTGSLSVDIVDSGGSSVASPSVTFPAKSFSWSTQTSDATLGTASEKIRVSNTTATATWSLEIAATDGVSTVWDGVTYSYDFNDTAANGRLEVDASGATIAPEGGCTSTGLSKGSSTYFSQGVTDSITILSAGGTADTGCYWDYTGIDLTQDIPASQEADTYIIDMTLTAS